MDRREFVRQTIATTLATAGMNASSYARILGANDRIRLAASAPEIAAADASSQRKSLEPTSSRLPMSTRECLRLHRKSWPRRLKKPMLITTICWREKILTV